MKLGVIADDFTGATDIASFLVENGISTVQLNGAPSMDYPVEADAIVVSLKSRSCTVGQAVADSLAALAWLQAHHCRQFYFKYCSTFDSTAEGNIGPVTDALLDALHETLTVVSPALPVNGRTVYQGYLFVMGQLLAESGMRHHPVTPMTDSNVPRLMERQAKGRCALIAADVIDRGAAAVKERLAILKKEGARYVVLDMLNERHLLTQGEALRDMTLVTGGSGLAIGLARQWAGAGHDKTQAQSAGTPQGERCVVLSGSCSAMTHLQVERYRQQAPARAVDIERCLTDSADYADQLCQWIEENSEHALAPLLFTTVEPALLKNLQEKFGAQQSSAAIERLFAALAIKLKARGFRRFIIAGGETAGVVVQSLGIRAFHIGPVISPGVPWVKATEQAISLALKSGNFGDENFFARAQTEFPL